MEKLEHLAPNRYKPVHLPDNISIHEWTTRNFKYNTDKKAIIDGPSGRNVTYGQIEASYRVLRHLLITSPALGGAGGMRKGDVFAIHAYNGPEHVVLVLAVLSAGGIVTTLNPLYTQYEIERQLKDCKAKYLCTSEDIVDNHAVEAARNTGVKHLLSCGAVRGCRDISALLLRPPAPALLRAAAAHITSHPVTIHPRDDCCFYLYSSGTTGLPKSVMLTHYSVVTNMQQARSVGMFTMDTGEIGLNMFPFYHIGGILGMLLSASQCATLVVFKQFHPEAYIKMLEKYSIDTILAAPPIALLLTKHPLAARADLRSLKTVYIGAAPLGGELSDELKRRIPSIRDICQAYGMTELSPVATASGKQGDWKHGSGGVLLPNTEAKVIDLGTGESLRCNESGEICVRGPQVMKGYLNNPEATRQTIDPHGWLHTGDIGYYDVDGFFFIVDRVKELIKYNAYQVAPAEIEDLLMKLPGIQDCGVVGVPDPRHGELPRAYVVRAPTSQGRPPVTEDDITKHVNKHLAVYKRLRGGVRFVSEIPKNPTGKILRRVLKEQAAKEQQRHRGSSKL